jgi:hypothetical protein
VGAGAAAVKARAGSLTDRGAERHPSPATEDGLPSPARSQPDRGEAGERAEDLQWLSPTLDEPRRLGGTPGEGNGDTAAGTTPEPSGYEGPEPSEDEEPEPPPFEGPEPSADLVPAGERRPTPLSGHDGERSGNGAGPVAGGAMAGVLGTVGERVTQYARRAVDKVSELSPDTQRVRTDPAGDGDAMPVMIPADPLTRDESKLALAIVAAFVILALVVGLYGVSRIGTGSSDIFGPAAAPVTRTTTVAPSPSDSESASPSDGASEEGPAPLEPLAIQGVQAYDPEGDGYEHDELTGTVVDGDPGTGWYTESYSSGEFGGIKQGVGLIVDVGTDATPREIQLQIPNRSGLEVWVNSNPSLDGATKIGEKDPAEGEVDFTVPDDVSGQYVVLWYTTVYPDAQGGIRGTLNEVRVLG